MIIIFNLKENKSVVEEAAKANIPVLGFSCGSENSKGLTYKIPLNIKNESHCQGVLVEREAHRLLLSIIDQKKLPPFNFNAKNPIPTPYQSVKNLTITATTNAVEKSKP